MTISRRQAERSASPQPCIPCFPTRPSTRRFTTRNQHFPIFGASTSARHSCSAGRFRPSVCTSSPCRCIPLRSSISTSRATTLCCPAPARSPKASSPGPRPATSATATPPPGLRGGSTSTCLKAGADGSCLCFCARCWGGCGHGTSKAPCGPTTISQTRIMWLSASASITGATLPLLSRRPSRPSATRPSAPRKSAATSLSSPGWLATSVLIWRSKPATASSFHSKLSAPARIWPGSNASPGRLSSFSGAYPMPKSHGSLPAAGG